MIINTRVIGNHIPRAQGGQPRSCELDERIINYAHTFANANVKYGNVSYFSTRFSPLNPRRSCQVSTPYRSSSNALAI